MNCPNCQNQLTEGTAVCPYCGTAINANQGMPQPINNGMPQQNMNQQQVNMNQQPINNGMPQQNMNQQQVNMNQAQPNMGQPMNGNRPSIVNRSVGMCILLSIVTCGIYGAYWFICLTNDSNSLSDQNKTASGGMAFLLSILTCGIYLFYWNFQLGKKMHEAGTKYGVQISDNSVLYLLLSVFGLGFVNSIIAQSDLNKFANQ